MSANPWEAAADAEIAEAAGDGAAAEVASAPAGDGVPTGPGRPPFRVRAAGALWRYTLGSILCWFALGAVVVVGWTQRQTRRWIWHRWWRVSPARSRGLSFEAFLVGSDRTAELLRPPRWILGVPWSDAGGRRLVGGLTRNLAEGFPAAANVFLYTLPAGLLWAAGWFAGWQVSFHKGYEDSMVGRLVFIAGMLLFLAAMGYVPLAQARQAVTGRARCFHDVGVIRRLLRGQWLAGALLAAAYFLFGLPVMLLRVVPFGLGNTGWVEAMNPQQQLHLVQLYYLAVGFVVFPAFLGLRLLAGSLYAGAVVSALRNGSLTESDLSEWEAEVLHRLELVRPHRPRAAGWFLAALRWLGSRVGRLVAVVVALVLWFLLIWQVLVSEFFNAHRFGRGWWNQPLVQIPWVDYTPVRLYRAAHEWRQAGRPPVERAAPMVPGIPRPASTNLPVPVPGTGTPPN